MALPGPSQPPPSLPFSDVPFKERWEVLKPHIKRLYIDENRELPEVISMMKRDFGFDAPHIGASGSSYKYQINRKWKLKKNIPVAKKKAMCDTLQTRAKAGKPTSISYQGKQVDLKKLRRVMKEDARKQMTLRAVRTDVNAGAGIFLNWNLPYVALRRSGGRAVDGPSPAVLAASTPSDVAVATPSSAHAPSPHGAPSPMSVALRRKRAVDRANLFLQGKHYELLQSMNKIERRDTSTWLYQFWLFSFRTAKNWGRGPHNWTADLMGFEDFHETISMSSPSSQVLTGTPRGTISSPGNAASPEFARPIPSPSSLCRWAIHVAGIEYESLPDPPAEHVCNPYDEETWSAWQGHAPADFVQVLTDGLESNDFSTIKPADLPVAVPQIVRAAKRSPKELLFEALSFAIMGRNGPLIHRLSKEIEEIDNGEKVDLGEIYPFHLATSYLDGSRTCCNTLDLLVSFMPPEISLRRTYTNNLGHTILDNLMISILKSHTSCMPGIVDDAWQKEKRWAGEEVDICGRWDADSECYRSLLAHGEVAVPLTWKHKFCHTSAQTITHCINTIFYPSYAPDINTTSGLFVKRCSNCGCKLELTVLQTLVLTAFALAEQGMAEEDLFGILACALCLLWHGADSSLTAEISLSMLLNADQLDHCSHEELTAIDLADLLAGQFQDAWTPLIQTGWQILLLIMRSSRDGPTSRDNSADIDLDDDAGDRVYHDFSGQKDCFYNNDKLATIYAMVQTELVTYRRIAEGYSWTSTNLEMKELLWSWLNEGKPRVGLLEKKLMMPFNTNGLFDGDFDLCVRADQASASYFMNMDIWSHATFIDMPERNHK